MHREYGIVTGRVIDLEDPEREGRVRVRFDELGDGDHKGYWAPIARMMAGKDRGTWYMPEIGDEVLVAFLKGDVRHPYVIGFLWNGKDLPPSNDPDQRLIRSFNHHEIEIYDLPSSKNGLNSADPGNKGYIRIKDAHGNFIELSNAKILIHSKGIIELDAPNVVITKRPVAPQPRPI